MARDTSHDCDAARDLQRWKAFSDLLAKTGDLLDERLASASPRGFFGRPLRQRLADHLRQFAQIVEGRFP
jgi:hypothetical protein